MLLLHHHGLILPRVHNILGEGKMGGGGTLGAACGGYSHRNVVMVLQMVDDSFATHL